jgi:hypothetical protein
MAQFVDGNQLYTELRASKRMESIPTSSREPVTPEAMKDLVASTHVTSLDTSKA